MHKPIIVLKVVWKKFSGVRDLALTVYDNMNLNSHFINPHPSMLTLKTATEKLTDAIAEHGQVGSRGGKQAYLDLVKQSRLTHTILSQLGAWCMSSVDPETSYEEQGVILNTAGFPLKNARAPQGRLEMVVDFHRVISRTLRDDQVKLAWKRPLGVTTRSNVKSYNVYRHSTNDFSTASIISSQPQATYIDEPASGTWYYWVTAVNNKGNSVTSRVVIAKIA